MNRYLKYRDKVGILFRFNNCMIARDRVKYNCERGRAMLKVLFDLSRCSLVWFVVDDALFLTFKFCKFSGNFGIQIIICNIVTNFSINIYISIDIDSIGDNFIIRWGRR